MASINERIRHLRQQKKLTQQELADMVGLRRVQLTKIESGTRRVSSVELTLFSDAFDVREEDLLRTAGAPAYRAANIDSPSAKAAIDWFDKYVETSELVYRMAELGA